MVMLKIAWLGTEFAGQGINHAPSFTLAKMWTHFTAVVTKSFPRASLEQIQMVLTI
jgi:hypothetical protein